MTTARFDADYLQNPAPAYCTVAPTARGSAVRSMVRVTAKDNAEQMQIKQGSGFACLDD